MKLIDTLTMKERLILLAILGGNGAIWGLILSLVAYLLDARAWVVFTTGCATFYAVSVGSLKFLEAIHDHKQK